jgi:hypothetical protein
LLAAPFSGTSRHAKAPFSQPRIVAAASALLAFLTSPFASAVNDVEDAKIRRTRGDAALNGDAAG